MRKQGRALAAFLLLAGLTLFFLAKEPAGVDRWMDAVSPEARWVSLHEQPVARLGELGERRREVRDLLRLLGVSEGEMEGLGRGGVLRKVTGDTLVIREAGMGRFRQPGTVVVSRVGAGHLGVRLGLEFAGDAGVRRQGKHRGRGIHVLETEGGQMISVALASGVLVVCVHPDPDAIREVLDRLDGAQPPLEVFRPGALDGLREADGVTDRGVWFGGPGRGGRIEVRGLWEAENSLVFEAEGPGLLPWFGSEREELQAFAARFGGPHVVSMAHLPPLSAWGVESGPIFLLLGSPYFMNLTRTGVPTPVVIFPVDSAEEARQVGGRFMGWVTSMTGAEWMELSGGVEDEWRYLPANDEALEWLRPDHAPAGRFRDGRLVLAGSGRVLDRLFERLDRPEAEFELRDTDWREGEVIGRIIGPEAYRNLRPLHRLLKSAGMGVGVSEERLEAIERLQLTVRRVGTEPFRIRVELAPVGP